MNTPGIVGVMSSKQKWATRAMGFILLVCIQ